MNALAGSNLVVGFACAFIVGAIIGCPIFAVLLRAGAKWGENMDIDFISALKTSFLVYVINFIISIVFAVIILAFQVDKQLETFINLASIPIDFIILAAIISNRHQVSFGKGAKIAIIIYLICFVIAIILGIVLFSVLHFMNN